MKEVKHTLLTVKICFFEAFWIFLFSIIKFGVPVAKSGKYVKQQKYKLNFNKMIVIKTDVAKNEKLFSETVFQFQVDVVVFGHLAKACRGTAVQ